MASKYDNKQDSESSKQNEQVIKSGSSRNRVKYSTEQIYYIHFH